MADACSESGMKVRHCAAAVSLSLFSKNWTKLTLFSVQGVRNLQRQDLCLKLVRCFVNKVGGIYIYSNKTMPKTKNIFSSRERLLEIDGLEWRQAKEYMQPSQRERGKWRDYGIEKGCILVWMHGQYASGNTSIANRCCNTMQQTVSFLEMEDSECRHTIFYKLQGKEEKARKQVTIWMNYQIAQCLHS